MPTFKLTAALTALLVVVPAVALAAPALAGPDPAGRNGPAAPVAAGPQPDGTGERSYWAAGRAIRQALLRAENALQDGEPAVAAAEVAKATAIYQEIFLTPFNTADPGLAAELGQELAAARAAVAADDRVRLAFARGLVWGMLLEGAFRQAMALMEAGDHRQAEAWLQLRERPERKPQDSLADPVAAALAGLGSGKSGQGRSGQGRSGQGKSGQGRSGQGKSGQGRSGQGKSGQGKSGQGRSGQEGDPIAAIRGELQRIYLSRLRRSLEEAGTAGERGFRIQQAFWAGASLGYYRILAPDLTGALGEEDARTLAAAFAEMAAMARQGRDPAGALAAIEEKLRLYSPVRWDEARVAERIGLIYTFLDLAVTEYRDAGVAGGRVRVPIEYQEAVSFVREAKAIITELYPYLHRRDPAGAADLSRQVAGVEGLVQEKAPLDRVAAEAERLRQAVAEVSGIGIEPAQGGAELLSAVSRNLARLTDLVAAGNYQDAESLRMESYALFESGPEATLRNRAPELAGKLEGLFWEGWGKRAGLRRLIASRAGRDEVAATVREIDAGLAEAGKVLAGPQTAAAAVVQSMSIIVREGLEAVLILAAVLGYLATTGQDRLRRHLYTGVLLALLGTAATWWLSAAVIRISGAGRELIEGVTGLLAVVVLFFVINWLFKKAYVDDWLAEVKSRAERAIRMESPLIMAGLGFMVVYREGFETVLFYQALLTGSKLAPVVIGLVAGLVLIAAVAYPLLVLRRRIPVKPFFKITGILLMLLAFKFTGSGLRELQEAGVLGSTPLAALPASLWVQELLGVFPTWETFSGQVLLLLALMLSWVVAKRRTLAPPQC